MNNSKIWLVVKPTVGVPLFLSAVAVGSFAVHVAVVSNTTWVADFLSGEELGGGGDDEASLMLNDDGVAKASLVGEAADGTRTIMVTMPDGSTALATLHDDELASAAPHLLPD